MDVFSRKLQGFNHQFKVEEFLVAVGMLLLDCRNPTAKAPVGKGPFPHSYQTSVLLVSNRWR